MHDLPDTQQQPTAEAAGGMGTGKVLGGESAAFEQGDRQGIAHRQGRGGARGRGKAERTGLARDAHVEVDIALPSQSGGGFACHADQGDAEPFEQRQEHEELGGFARVGQGQHDIAGRDHPEVAVAGLARMHEEGGTPGAGQGRRDLSADVARFAHPEHDDAALAGQHVPAGGDEVVVDPLGQSGDRGGLGLDDGAPERLDLDGVAKLERDLRAAESASICHAKPRPERDAHFRVSSTFGAATALGGGAV